MDITKVLEDLELLKQEQAKLRQEFELYKENTDCKIELLKEKLDNLEAKIHNIEENTNVILNLGVKQTDKIDSLLDKFSDRVLKNNEELMQANSTTEKWYQTMIIKIVGSFSLGAIVMAIIKFILGL